MKERTAGRYEVLRRLGGGGMGEVYLARDRATGRECALKRLNSRPGARFHELRREFEVLSRVRHPAIVSVLDLGLGPDGVPFYTMEYVPGVSADRAVPRGGWRALFSIAVELTHGLEALHAAEIVHGDLKPSNILVVPGGPGEPPAGVRLLDFGLARVLGDAGAGHRGTPGYAAPEVVAGEPPTRAADLYGLGATLYHLIAGRAAFQAASLDALLRRQRSEPPDAVALQEAGAPSALVALVLRLMAIEPAERPRHAREVRLELESLDPTVVRPLAERLRGAAIAARERELAWIERQLARKSTRARVLVIVGPAGIGKSTVLRELARRSALEAQANVVHLACGDLAAPGAGALALARCFAAAAAVDPEAAPAGVADLFSATASSPSAADLDRLVPAAIEWLRAAAAGGPPPRILLDDADRLDALSRQFVTRLLLQPDAGAGTWILTLAAGGGSEPTDFDVLVEAGVAARWPLGSLDREGVERLASLRLGQPAPPGLATFLWERAAGHPGLTVELMLGASAAGALSDESGEVVLRADRLPLVEVPETFTASLRGHFERLPEPARRAAAVLAVSGVPLDPALLATLDPAAAGESADLLVRAGIAAFGRDGRMTLVSRAWAELALAPREPAELARLHRAVLGLAGLDDARRFRHLRAAGDVAEALAAAEAAFARAPDASLAREAAELATTADPARAADWHERAARELAKAGRHSMALTHFQRAIDVDPSPESGLRRLEPLAASALRAGLPVEAGRVIERGLADEPGPALRARLLARDAMRLHLIGDLDGARRRGQEALAAADSAGDAEARGLAAHSLAYTLAALGLAAEAEPFARMAVESHERSGDAVALIRARAAVAAVAHARQRLEEAERLYDHALADARALGSGALVQEVLVNLGVVLAESGRWERLREANGEVLRIALAEQSPRAATIATANLAQMDGLTGRPRAAVRGARAAIRLARAHHPNHECAGWRALAQGWRIQGRPDQALRAARRGLDLATRAGFQVEIDWCRIEYARVCASAGRWGEAAATCLAGVEEPRPSGSSGYAVLMSLAGRADLRNDQLERAEARLQTVDEWLRRHNVPYAAALAEQLRAEIALHRGRVSDAVESATRVMRQLQSLPAPADRAAAALDLARLALQAPAPERAPVGDWLEQAASGFGRLGDRRGREQALAHQVHWLRRAAGSRRLTRGDRDLLDSVSRLLHSLSDLRELTRRAMEMVVEQLGAERGVLLLLDPETGRLQPIAERGTIDAGARREAVGFSRRVVQRVTESGGFLLIGDAPADPLSLSDSMVDLHLRSIVCVPLFLGGKVVGAVYLDSRDPETFGDSERALLEGFAHLMAIAIDRCRGHEEVQRTNEVLVGENLSLRQVAATKFQPHRLVGASTVMQRILPVVERAALASSTVLITGENGTGKELIARILHHSGKRAMGPFVAVNCGAIPETLLESELFGILPNVATGVRGRDGRFRQADGGTLFLDEIGDMPPNQQVALLAAIANREITPLGGGNPIPVDVRIIAATNRDLRKLIEQGSFREDLFFRLHVIPIEVPPLRDRKADIPNLAHHFAGHFAEQQEREVPELSAEFLAALMQSDWPGNVRELQNYIERVMAMNPGRVLYPSPPPRDLEERPRPIPSGSGRGLNALVEDLERRMVLDALRRARGNQSRAARELGLPEQAIRYRIRKYGINVARENRRTREEWRMTTSD